MSYWGEQCQAQQGIDDQDRKGRATWKDHLQLPSLEEKGNVNYPLVFMSITRCCVQSWHWGGGRRRQTLSAAQSVLPQGTVTSESKLIPPSLCGTLLFLLLRLRKSSQVVFTALVDTGTISPCFPQSTRWQKSFQKCWKTNQIPQGLVFIWFSVTAAAQCSKILCQISPAEPRGVQGQRFLQPLANQLISLPLTSLTRDNSAHLPRQLIPLRNGWKCSEIL